MAKSDQELLSDAELVDQGRVTYAALILLGTRQAVGRYLPQAELIFEYRSGDATGGAQAREEYRQGFFSYYEGLWNLINLRNDTQHFQDGLFLLDIKTFNERAIREALLNAISHRDYRLGGSVFVRQYPRRIEVVSPGGPPPGITFDNILFQQSPRNRRIAETLSKCGLVERSGQGMNTIYEACIRENDRDGSRMEELKQVLPGLGLNSIQRLLRDLVKENLIHARGRTKAGRWHIGPLSG